MTKKPLRSIQAKGRPTTSEGARVRFKSKAELEGRGEIRKSKLGHTHMSTRFTEMDPALAGTDPDNMSYQCTIWLPRALIWAIDKMAKNHPLRYRNRSHFALIALYRLYREEQLAFSESMEGK